jgi:thiol-disulfide isomerase/thioredoxin
MKDLFRAALILTMCAVLLSGCGETPRATDANKASHKEGAKSDSPAPTSATAANGSAAPAADVQLEKVSCEQWDKAFAAQKGKIVVVDTWATWCVPCVEEFPHLVELHGKHAKDGVVCMSVSVDEPEPEKYTAALDFLKSKKATFANYLIQDEGEAWWDKWEIKAIPVVLVFGRDGKLVKKFDKDDPDNQFTYDDVEKLVAELLAKPS